MLYIYMLYIYVIHIYMFINVMHYINRMKDKNCMICNKVISYSIGLSLSDLYVEYEKYITN